MKINNTQKGAIINTNTIKNMLRYKTETRPGLVALYTTSGQETERVHSYNPGARTGPASLI